MFPLLLAAAHRKVRSIFFRPEDGVYVVVSNLQPQTAKCNGPDFYSKIWVNSRILRFEAGTQRVIMRELTAARRWWTDDDELCLRFRHTASTAWRTRLQKVTKFCCIRPNKHSNRPDVSFFFHRIVNFSSILNLFRFLRQKGCVKRAKQSLKWMTNPNQLFRTIVHSWILGVMFCLYHPNGSKLTTIERKLKENLPSEPETICLP